MRWSVAVIGACAGLSGCGDPRTGEDMASALPTGASMSAGSSSTAGDDSGSDSETAGSTSSSPGGPKLDVGSGQTSGVDPDGPMTCEENIDIVFVMDVSTTMGPFLDKLADEILVVDQALQALELPAQPHYGLVVFVDDTALLQAGGPYPDVQTLQDEFSMWSSFTSSNQQVGGGNSNSTWPENSLDALYSAAAGYQWRPSEDTLRLVIHTTDDTFWDGPTTGNGVQIQHGYAETVQALQDRQIRVFSFAAQIGGSCECEDVTPGWSTPYMGMSPIPEATDGGVFDIDEVLAGSVSLADAIGDSVDASMCEPYTPVG